MSREKRIGRVRLGARPVVVAAGGEAELEALAAADGADVVEVRADLFRQPTAATLTAALARVRDGGRPIVLTVRSASEGGGLALPDDARAALYAAGLPLVDAIDVEIASAAVVADLVPRAQAAGRTVLLSMHDFARTPSFDVLLGLIERARELGADVPKVATHAATLDELRTLLETTLAARADGIVVLGMGPLGPLSRLVLPAAGSLLTYAAAGRPTAPGQLPLAELTAELARLFPA